MRRFLSILENGSFPWWKALSWVLCLTMLVSLSGCSLLFPPRSIKFIQYPVQAGDTLSAIGTRFTVSVDELKSFNNIGDPRSLRIGQIVRVPYRGQDLSRKGPSGQSNTKSSSSSLASRKPSSGWDPEQERQAKLGKAQKHIGRLVWPVPSVKRVSSRFGRRWLSFHEGIDIAAGPGTPIHSAHAGLVVYSGSGLRGYGNLIIIQGDHILSVYAHNKRNSVRKGERVRQNQKIGEVGATGNVTGPHLHYEIRIKGPRGKFLAVDPMVFYP